MTDLNGTIDARFEPLAQILRGQLESGYDLGASLAVAVDGQIVTDCWGGWADEAETEPWQSDTITNVWSTTKTMTALCALILIDRGLLDPTEKVATYWPEFADNGKADIEVRHIMSHTSGVSAWAQPVTVDDILDDDKATAMLAGQAPWWEPGTASGYHALNQGHLVGEVVRRIDGRGLKQFFAEEVADPLGADFTIGAPASERGRISNVIPPPPLPMPDEIDLESVMIKTFTGPAPEASISHTAAWRDATIGAANGHGNARSVATIQAAVSNGGRVGDTQLLSADTVARIFEQQSNGVDLVLGMPVSFGLGYALADPIDAIVSSGQVCYWGGWGGSIVVNDLDHRVTMAYMMNRMQAGLVGNDTSVALYAALRSILD
ncbi:MAG: serine hydrolase domain-containing protein [Ilumatobacter sp.]|uniref:serine hydrolase domain-containing protein n=1 Tax=Ilumatobacter sp. TaxID=1967498 RepID=UPI003C767F77